MYTVYALKSLTRNYIYVGMTSDLEKRILRHNSGYEKTTKPYRPFKLIFSETTENREKARIREKFFKSGIGKDFLRQLS
jgi:putative endonuclease